MPNDFGFSITNRSASCNARTGLLQTPHGTVETPAFVFCATKAVLKCMMPSVALDMKTDIILANTYHLMVNGGSEYIKKAGGIHKFMSWHKPMFTDSGGYQIFSLGHGSVANEIKRTQSTDRQKSLVKITQEGAVFRSYLDGTKHFLTPEKSIQIQNDIGSDFVFVLDECTPYNVDKEYTERSMLMSHAWEERSLKEFKKLQQDSDNAHKQAIYGIIQGGVYQDLRKTSANFIMDNDFFGIGIGGSLGGSREQMNDVVSYTCDILSKRKDMPRHLLGIGVIQDILNLVAHGIDTFDCVHPSRIARHGHAILKFKDIEDSSGTTVRNAVNMKNSKFKDDQRPIDKQCHCCACERFSRSYIHYLLKIGEPLAMALLTAHNAMQMNTLMADIRSAIRSDSLKQLRHEWIDICSTVG